MLSIGLSRFRNDARTSMVIFINCSGPLPPQIAINLGLQDCLASFEIPSLFLFRSLGNLDRGNRSLLDNH